MSRLPIDTAEIRALAEILADIGLTEIEVADGDTRIRVARMPSPMPAAAVPAYLPAAMPAAEPSAPAPLTIDPANTITSPMVGVVYLAPEPGQPPFVTMGQAVSAGQTVLLIEAMKTFNQIKAPKAGTVTRILVTTGQPVEYGEVLLVVE